MRTVSNTSPISNLAYIGQLHLLREQFGELWIPQSVFGESSRIAHPPTRELVSQAVDSGWPIVRPVCDVHKVSFLLPISTPARLRQLLSPSK
jgi:predicted nucleic acid-binding protein